MQYVADLHLHSRYSRAVSQDMILPTMARFAKQKGLDILTASDWTHPLWFKEITTQLEEAYEGVYSLKADDGKEKTLFVLSTEISSIYTQGGKLRRIHNLIFVPGFDAAEKISKELVSRGCNLNADGRPIIGLSSKSLLELILGIDERCMLIPCHVWTPHFGIYGSASGFDSLEEAFEDLAPHIYGIETGLSSDPEMNWQIKELEKRTILSFSDAHSPAKMGREATVLELTEPTYGSIRKAFMQKAVPSSGFENRVVYTVEFYPEEGKYHFSGHRGCGVSFGPSEIKEKGTICPVCHKRLTEGVLNRLLQLSDPSRSQAPSVKTNEYGLRWYTDATKHHPPYVKLVPLLEIVAESMKTTVVSQKTKTMLQVLTQALGSELDILLKTPLEEVRRASDPAIAEAIGKVRAGDISIRPGFDGEFGKVAIWQEGDDPAKNADDAAQMNLDI